MFFFFSPTIIRFVSIKLGQLLVQKMKCDKSTRTERKEYLLGVARRGKPTASRENRVKIDLIVVTNRVYTIQNGGRCL